MARLRASTGVETTAELVLQDALVSLSLWLQDGQSICITRKLKLRSQMGEMAESSLLWPLAYRSSINYN
jgi:hypothetical protein